MQEKLLHFIWQNLLFDLSDLKTETGEELVISRNGTYNTHAGPDFMDAKIRINGTLWAGQVEIHINSTDWLLHNHHKDKAYDNTILHVCWEDNGEIYRTDGSKIMCLTLKNRVPEMLLKRYRYLMESSTEIPCKSLLKNLDRITMDLWLERLVVERLEQKTNTIFDALKSNHNSWNDAFYIFIARSFGLNINSGPFEHLAHQLPLNIITKHKQNLFQIEALVFGVAGFLHDNLIEEYPRNLYKEYSFLKLKYQLKELSLSEWKFLRMMPANFPTIRLAQFSALIHQSNHLFSKITRLHKVKELNKLLCVEPSVYWNNHYVFGEISKKKSKATGQQFISNTIINCILPFQFAYGMHKGEDLLKEKALDLLSELKPEQNSIVRQWEKLGFLVKNSSQSQAFLQLKNEYCSAKRCINCRIGYTLLKT